MKINARLVMLLSVGFGLVITATLYGLIVAFALFVAFVMGYAVSTAPTSLEFREEDEIDALLNDFEAKRSAADRRRMLDGDWSPEASGIAPDTPPEHLRIRRFAPQPVDPRRKSCIRQSSSLSWSTSSL